GPGIHAPAAADETLAAPDTVPHPRPPPGYHIGPSPQMARRRPTVTAALPVVRKPVPRSIAGAAQQPLPDEAPPRRSVPRTVQIPPELRQTRPLPVPADMALGFRNVQVP